MLAIRVFSQVEKFARAQGPGIRVFVGVLSRQLLHL